MTKLLKLFGRTTRKLPSTPLNISSIKRLKKDTILAVALV